jgi:transcriptional regulator with XRE-family HTH domain
MHNFSKKVINLLDDKKFTKKFLAEEMGIARNTLNDYLDGRTSITMDALEKLSKAFDVEPSYFFEEDGTEPGSSSKTAGLNEKVIKLEEKIKARETELMELYRENRDLRIKLDNALNQEGEGCNKVKTGDSK